MHNTLENLTSQGKWRDKVVHDNEIIDMRRRHSDCGF